MLQKLFPDTDCSSLDWDEVLSLETLLFGVIPEEELLSLATSHLGQDFEWKLQVFLGRRLSEAILLDEMNENDSPAMNFLDQMQWVF